MAGFEPHRLMITGGAGFIGCNLTRATLAGSPPGSGAIEKLVVLDALTYAGHRVNLDDVIDDPRLELVVGDICDRPLVERLFAEHSIDAVFHLAAESHVDRSIEAPDAFVRTNVTGTFTLIDVA